MTEAPARTIWWEGEQVAVLDQRRLPHQVEVARWATVVDAVDGIRDMQVRGAPLIGVAAAHGVALALSSGASDADLDRALASLAATRPTAVNLRWALERTEQVLRPVPVDERAPVARALATRLADDDARVCRAIGEAGAVLLAEVHRRTGSTVQVLTHCNAGWLACVEWGTALAPVYVAAEQGVPLHVWVSETRPRSQGALTAWELTAAGVACTAVADNACGHLLASGGVDAVLVGADRVAANGDVANKVGTYLKALAARASGVPLYVALPDSTIDRRVATGHAIPIEERSQDEVLTATGAGPEGEPVTVRTWGAGTAARNWAFDVTPARLVSAYVTERGVLRLDALVDGSDR